MADAAALSLTVYRKVTDILAKLTDDQLAALLDGSGDLAFVSGETMVRAHRPLPSRSRSTSAAKLDAHDVAERLRQITDSAEAEAYLTGSSVTRDQLREIGTLLDVFIPKSLTRPRMISSLVGTLIGSKGAFDTVSGRSRQR